MVGLGIGFGFIARASAVSPPPPPLVANIAFTGNGTDTVDLLGNGSIGATSYSWQVAWTVSEPAFSGGPTFNASDSWSGNWTGTNPGNTTVENPSSITASTIPHGGYTISLQVGDGVGTDSANAYMLQKHVVDGGEDLELLLSHTQGPAITGNVTISNAEASGDSIIVSGITIPANAVGVSVVLMGPSGFSNDQTVTTPNGEVTFENVEDGTYGVFAWGFGYGRNGPVLEVASEIEVGGTSGVGPEIMDNGSDEFTERVIIVPETDTTGWLDIEFTASSSGDQSGGEGTDWDDSEASSEPDLDTWSAEWDNGGDPDRTRWIHARVETSEGWTSWGPTFVLNPPE